ncbi:MAG TPA: hypothetical protein VGL56_08350 [Fimbriimonadaceae bacterium]|jgi:hypothetical protein
MKKYGGHFFWGIFALVSGFLLILASANLAFHPKTAIETDHSTINLVSLSDGVHPWLTLDLQTDPADTDLRHLSWSPIGRTLAFLDGDDLRTWNPNGSAQLTGGHNWKGPFWSPDGEFLVVTSPQKTLIFNQKTMDVQQEFDGENTVWWSNGKMCSAKLLDPNKRTKKDIQSFLFGNQELKLPAGLSLTAASSDGKVLLAQTNFMDNDTDPGSFMLMGMDTKTGSVIWINPAPRAAAHNFATPQVLWNEKYQLATQTVDAGGGFDLHGYAQSGGKTLELKFANSANYSWISGNLSWTGEELFAPMTLAKIIQASKSATSVKFWNELALFDGQTHNLRTVSTGIPFEEAAASEDYVAMIIPGGQGVQIVVCPWTKDEKGKITGVTYHYEPPKQPSATQVEMAKIMQKINQSGSTKIKA